MITLVTQWFVIFFESKEVCAKLLNKNDLSDKDFEKRKYIVQTLEDITYENGSIMFFINGQESQCNNLRMTYSVNRFVMNHDSS